MVSSYRVAWWNLENLFDERDAPDRSDKLQRAIGRDLAGWTRERRDTKIAQLASAIARMGDGAGPDLLGVCEVENERVLGLLRDRLAAALPDRSYAVVHADTSDQRGIDVAFVYDTAYFTAGEHFQHVVMRRTATREILQVNFRTHRDRLWVLFANHWPSRSGGAEVTAGYRAIAGETLAYFHERVRQVHGADTPVLVMGDFNDEPFDDSLVRHALSVRQDARVRAGRNPYLLNLTWEVLGERAGTFYFDNEPNVLDQFLVNKAMLQPDAPVAVVPASVEVVRLPGMVAGGRYPYPIAFGGIGERRLNEQGYSDHSPITVEVVERD